jgi:hypothetical protein
MASKKQKAYFGLDSLISLILAIIPFTNVLFGIVIRVQRGELLGALLNFILSPLFYLVDLFTVITKKDITFLA